MVMRKEWKTMLIITDAKINREREMEGKENTYVRLGEKKKGMLVSMLC